MGMRSYLGVALLIVATVGPARGEDGAIAATDRNGIRTAIEQQIAAFARDDASAAFSYASPAIQRQFGSPDVFMQMVQNGYAAVYRPRSVRFGEARIVEGVIVQQVDLIGPNGLGEHAFYIMERADDGKWRINGVTLTADGEHET
jgi:hypothetical protein